jgi:hypothetical protein
MRKFNVGDVVRFSGCDGYETGTIIKERHQDEQGRWGYGILALGGTEYFVYTRFVKKVDNSRLLTV